MIVLAAASQFALYSYLYGRPSLNGDQPPFLTARIIADGPGRWYLKALRRISSGPSATTSTISPAIRTNFSGEPTESIKAPRQTR